MGSIAISSSFSSGWSTIAKAIDWWVVKGLQIYVESAAIPLDFIIHYYGPSHCSTTRSNRKPGADACKEGSACDWLKLLGTEVFRHTRNRKHQWVHRFINHLDGQLGQSFCTGAWKNSAKNLAGSANSSSFSSGWSRMVEAIASRIVERLLIQV